ncbi:MAG TPA: hypothetical protein VHI54_08950 [Actinomycetota bacterium]|nr:hypothetical protein [Actinomycetota bacterium]
MDAYMITFRIIHIVSAILWFGAATFYSVFVGPSLASIGPQAANTFYNHLVRQRRAVAFFRTVSTLTVVAGGFLYWRDSSGLKLDWITTSAGIGFTVGAVFGIASWLLVLGIISPTAIRLAAVGEQISAGGGPPSQEQTASLQAMSSRLRSFSFLLLALLAVAAIAMASARYLVF